MSNVETLYDISPSDIIVKNGVTINQIGIDTIKLIGRYETVKKMVFKEGLEITKAKANTPVTQTIEQIKKEALRDAKRRYQKDEFKPIIEVVKIGKGKSLSNYMVIVRFIPLTMDWAIEQKKAKGEYCMIVFAGLHQPSKKLDSVAEKIMSKFTKRKTFKSVSIDIAIDTEDREPINKDTKEGFKESLKPLSNFGVELKGSSFYINNVCCSGVDRVLYYDKYKKQQHQGQKLDSSLKHWKRLEITITNNPKEAVSFGEYAKSMKLLEDFIKVYEVASRLKISFDSTYLNYQINSIMDNRFMNNNASKKQFNSVEALKRFSNSNYRRYALDI